MSNRLYIFSLIALLTGSHFSFAQEEESDPSTSKEAIKEATFGFHHIGLETNSTFNKSRYEALTGSDLPNDPYLWMPSMDLKYTFNFGMPFAIRLKTGFGGHGYRWQVDPKYGYPGTAASAWVPIVYGGYFYQEVGIEFKMLLGKRWLLNFGADAGVTLFSIGELLVEGEPYGYDFELDWDDSINENVTAKPMVSFQLGVDRITKNKNTIGFFILYNHYPMPGVSGTYSLYGGTSTGKVYNQNSNLGFGINYLFNLNKKKHI